MAYLPDLIRDGAKKTAPAREAYYRPLQNKACALGAAALSAFGKEDIHEDNLGLKGVELGEDTEPPMTRDGLAPITSLRVAIVEMNDFHEMSREAIAEWLEAEVDDEKLQIELDEDEEEKEAKKAREEREPQPA